MLPDVTNQTRLEVLRNLNAPIWIFDAEDARICWANTRALEFWQAASLEELQQRSFAGDSSSVKDRLAAIVRTLNDAETITETWTLYPDDAPKAVDIQFQAIDMGLPQRALLVEVLQTRLATIPSNDELRLTEAARSAQSIITMMSSEGRILSQNAAGLRVYGQPLPAHSEMTDIEQRMLSQRDLKTIQNALGQNAIVHLDARVQTLDGPKTHSIKVQRGRDPVSGESVGLLTEDDVTKLSGLYRAERQQASKLEATVADSLDRLERTKARIDRAFAVAAIWDWDIEDDKIYFSRNFMELLEYEPEDFVEKLRRDRFESIVHPGDYVDYLPILEKFLANPDMPLSHEMRFVTQSGENLWIQIEGKCFCDGQGKPVRTAGLLTDITQKKQMEATILASQKLEAIGKLTGGIAHDFNNLLTVILGNVQLLQEVGVPDEELVSEVVAAVERGASLTRHLLAFARKQSLHPETVDIAKLCMQMRGTLLRILSERINIDYEGDDDVWHISADVTQVEAAILNLALNARDAMPTGGTLTIACENVTIDDDRSNTHATLKQGNYVCISVTDTGIGMDEDTLSRAFDPFFTTKEVGQGTGLGLSMALGFSEQSGGTTLIRSELGHGTTASIYLPKATERAEACPVPPKPQLLKGRGEHIHILEDNLGVSATVGKIVQSLGYRISTSTTVEEALRVAQGSTKIDAYIVDVILPGGQSGVDFAEKIAQIQPDPKLILVSGYSDTELARDMSSTADFDFLPKPFSRLQLSRALANALKGRPNASGGS